MNTIVKFLVISTLFWSIGIKSVSAQERRVYVDPSKYYEMVYVEVVNLGKDGSGTLRIAMHDCGGCTEDFLFNSDSVFQSPLGTYAGLEKVADWDEQQMLVVVGREDGIVRRVTVN